MLKRIRQYKILIIEDEEDLSNLYVRILKKHFGADKIECVCRGDSENADKLLLDRVFDLVISCIALPSVDGLSFLGQMRERGVDIPWIIATGQTSPEARAAAEKLGCSAFITKPIEVEEFLKAVAQFLDV